MSEDNGRAPDGGPARHVDPDETYSAVLDYLRDLEQQVLTLRKQLNAVDATATEANGLDLASVEANLHTVTANIEALKTRQDQLTEALDSVTAAVDALSRTPREKFPVTRWLDGDQQEVAHGWGELYRWTREILWGRYVTKTDGIKPCWYLHPDLVDEFDYLRSLWCRAYRVESATPERAAEFHDRWLPHAIARARHETAECDAGHKPPAERRPWIDDETRFRALADESIRSRPAPPQKPPTR